MGTNYYWRDRQCVWCGRHTEMHVCKSLSTWRAYRHTLLNDSHPDWGYQHESPVGFPILALSDWQRVFAERTGELWDEYGARIPDPLAWLAEARPWQSGQGGRRCVDEDIQNGEGWLDDAGYRFYASEFC